MRQIRVLAISVAVVVWLSGGAVSAQEPVQPEAGDQALQEIQNSIQTVQQAMQNEPARPALIQTAAAQGAQVRYLGKHNGFDGWFLLNQGNPSYLYVSEDGNTVFQGLMYDGDGTPITMRQIGAAQMSDPVLHGESVAEEQAQNPDSADASRSPGATLYDALSVVNSFALGSTDANAPLLYAFIDPDCPHCKEFLKDAEVPFLQTNKIQLRIIPVGILSDDSAKRAAYLLSQENPGALLMAHAKGEKPLPAPEGLTMDGQKLNTDLFRLWKFDGTPILVFKDKAGTIMMVRGLPKDMSAIIGSIGAGA